MQDTSFIIAGFWNAPPQALFDQKTVATVIGFSQAWLERGRWAGYGPSYKKIGRKVLYSKADVADWLNQHPSMQSTAEHATRSVA
jgi:predicted DNA-binding transcriptional regulator AlpA